MPLQFTYFESCHYNSSLLLTMSFYTSLMFFDPLADPCIFIWSKIPLLLLSLPSLTCGAHTSASPSTSPPPRCSTSHGPAAAAPSHRRALAPARRRRGLAWPSHGHAVAAPSHRRALAQARRCRALAQTRHRRCLAWPYAGTPPPPSLRPRRRGSLLRPHPARARSRAAGLPPALASQLPSPRHPSSARALSPRSWPHRASLPPRACSPRSWRRLQQARGEGAVAACPREGQARPAAAGEELAR